MSDKNWNPEQLALLGTMPDSELAARLGRTTIAVTVRRKKAKIGAFGGSKPGRKAKPVVETTYETDREEAGNEVWKSRYSQLQTKYEKALKENSVTQQLVEDIVAIAPRSYSPAPMVYHSERRTTSKAQSALLQLSDTHVGQVITPEQTLGFGRYDFPTFLARLKYLEESIVSIVENHTTVKIEELVVAMLGDMLHGNLSHAVEAGQHHTLFSQYYNASHAFAQFLRTLAAHFPQVRVYNVVGNHTRWGTQRKMPTENRFSNLDMFVYAMVEALTKDIPNIKWDLNAQPFALFEVQGFTCYAAHGDHLRGGDKALGIPNHAFGRQISTSTQLFAKHQRQAPHYYFTGHLHRGISLPHALGEIIVNGGFPGLDNYALAENFNPIDPMQRLMFFHPKFGRTAEYPLSLKFAQAGSEPPYTLPQAFPM
jgi:hypothetical protein